MTRRDGLQNPVESPRSGASMGGRDDDVDVDVDVDGAGPSGMAGGISRMGAGFWRKKSLTSPTMICVYVLESVFPLFLFV